MQLGFITFLPCDLEVAVISIEMKLLLVCLSILGLTWAYGYDSGSSHVNTTCACGWRNSGRIVGGKETKRNEYPWMVSLGGCGGSIITKWHVLTAAHCTYGKRASQMSVSVGRHSTNIYKDTYSEEFTVERIIQHERYVHGITINDISVLVTSRPMTFNQYIGPVCMPNRRVNLVGQYIKVMGWGLTKGTGDRSSLREVDLRVTTLDSCKRYWRNLQFDGTQLCAFENDKDSCNGDSGGPLVYLDPETNRYTQAALVSYGVGACGMTEYPSVNTDVSGFVDWINRAVSSSKPSERVCTKN